MAFDGGNANVDTVYFGGGTPSLMSPNDIKTVLDAVKHTFTLCDNSEITLEANPCTVDFEKLFAFKQAGIKPMILNHTNAKIIEINTPTARNKPIY